MKFISIFIPILFSLSTAVAQPIWNKIPSNTTNKLNSISFGSEQVGYIGGDDRLILKTIDGGTTWNPIQHVGLDSIFTPPIEDIIHIEFVSETNGFVIINDSESLAYYTGGLYKTTDGGQTWEQETNFMCSFYKTFHFNENKGFTIGSSCFGGKTIAKKENGVYSVNIQYLSWNIDYLKAIDFVDTLQGIVAGDSAQIHRTFDGGMTWDTTNINNFPPSSIPVTITDLMYLNDSTVVFTSNVPDYIYSISNDNGLNWNHVLTNTFLDPQIKAIAHSKKDSIISVGINFNDSLGFIGYYDKSNAWQNYHMTNEALNEIDMQNDSTAFIVGDKGAIYTNSGALTSVNDMYQWLKVNIYPNPASNWIVVESEPMKSIEVNDVDGRLMKRMDLTNEQLVQLNTKGWENGNYFLKIHFSDGQIYCKQVAIFQH